MKAALLLSTGIDSPVAGYLAKKRGIEIIGVHFCTSPSSLEIVKQHCKSLGISRLYIVDHAKNLAECDVEERLRCVICKRLMYKIAEKIAEKESCDFLVTGENLGQVASQTLGNLSANYGAVKMLIVRPLLCNDKAEIIEIAKSIGTYETSIKQDKKCSFLPKKPATTTTNEKILESEKKINALADNAVVELEILS